MTTMQLEATSAPALKTRVLSDSRYALTGFPLGLAALVACVTGFSLGLGLATLWIGLPIMAASLMWARAFADAERTRIAAVLGHAVAAPAYRVATAPTLHRRLLAAVADPQSWRDLLHALLRFIPGTVSFSFVLAWWSAMLGSLTWSLWGWALPDGPGEEGLPELLGFGDAYLTEVLFQLALAVVLALTLPTVARLAALLQARFAALLLSGR